ncbi:hypothetical protein M3Y94_00252400 [Aphelenchoides besseyi]|nr:hypothetical protein M3Y94_00252400 [Aphelenchoides besseyi]KAI6236239.1 Cell cycle regulator Mat89Bb [Aphelenchoides besseyi]
MIIRSNIEELYSHKTIVAIDCTDQFAAEADEKLQVLPAIDGTSGQFQKSSQTRWASAAAGVFELHRILVDLYPYGSKLLRLATTGGRYLTNEWGERLLTYNKLTIALDKMGPDPSTASNSTVQDGLKSGLTMCIEALKVPTKLQQKVTSLRSAAYKTPNNFQSLSLPPLDDVDSSSNRAKFFQRLQNVRKNVYAEHFRNKVSPIRNSGTVIMFTSVRSMHELNTILRNAEDTLAEQNYNRYQTATEVRDLPDLEIARVRLFLIHVGAAYDSPLDEIFMDQASVKCRIWRGRVVPTVYFSSQTQPIFKIIHRILNDNYGVSATVVNDIPMKDENERRSINYNVEILHHRKVHSFFRRLDLFHISSPIVRAGDMYPTVHLKWAGVNPRFVVNDPPLFNHSGLGTLAYVRDRAAICISNFVLAGKNVLLDMHDYAEFNGVQLDSTFYDLNISHFFSLDFNLDAINLKCMDFYLKAKHVPIGRSSMPSEVEAMIEYFMRMQLTLNYLKQPQDQNPRPIFVNQLEQIESFGKSNVVAAGNSSPAPVRNRSRSNSPAVKRPRYSQNWVKNETVNVFEFYTQQLQQRWRSWKEFEGRRNSNGPVAELYQNLTTTERIEPTPGVRPQRSHGQPRRRNIPTPSTS